ncbi:hypothetical protein Rcae01_04388 [Novipirellula caenicola]|uniref:Amino acid kinase family protein n=2 Tax=Novipirellula caenicola TaxID=1536901 RepID=A0ABP9VUU5_9BACT
MRRVIKIGGSLMSRPDLPSCLPKLLDAIAAPDQPATLSPETVLPETLSPETLVIVGGGELVDSLRSWDQLRSLDPVKTHWQCIDLLQYTFEVISDWFPAWHRVDTAASLQQSMTQGFSTTVPNLIAVRCFYDRGNQGNLPHDWRTTSDSLAAKLCSDTDADELVLLKSCEVDPSWDRQSLISRGVIDEAFAAFDHADWKLRIVSANAVA